MIQYIIFPCVLTWFRDEICRLCDRLQGSLYSVIKRKKIILLAMLMEEHNFVVFEFVWRGKRKIFRRLRIRFQVDTKKEISGFGWAQRDFCRTLLSITRKRCLVSMEFSMAMLKVNSF